MRWPDLAVDGLEADERIVNGLAERRIHVPIQRSSARTQAAADGHQRTDGGEIDVGLVCSLKSATATRSTFD